MSESSSLMTQSAKMLYLFLVGMSELMCSILFCIFVTEGEFNRDVAFLLEIVTLSCSSMVFLLYSCKCFVCWCAVQITCYRFVVCGSLYCVFFFKREGFDSYLESLFDIYEAHTSSLRF